jgi:DNA-directed RNA polymerase subunit N (RpoN/RPB10)
MDEEKGVNATCGECGKSAAEGWALYCVQCYEASMVKAAVAAEREACALVAESYEPLCDTCPSGVANAIRARGEEPKRHPGYIIGDHWLQAAYTRICTGETEADVMADYGWQRESR